MLRFIYALLIATAVITPAKEKPFLGKQNWEIHYVDGNKILPQDKDVFVTVASVNDTELVSTFTKLAEKGATVTVVLSTNAYSDRNLWNNCMVHGCKVYWNKKDEFDNVAIFSYKGLELSEGDKKREYLLALSKFYFYLSVSDRIN